MDLDHSFMCVSQNGWSMILWSEYWFLEMGSFFFFVFFLCVLLVSYLVTKFWFLLLLRLMGSWILEMGFVCRCDWYHIFKVLNLLLHRSMGSWIWAFLYQHTLCVWKLYFFIVWSIFCCSGIVINVRPIISIIFNHHLVKDY